MKIHLDIIYLQCPLLHCDKKYTRIATIRQHLFSHASNYSLSLSDAYSICNALSKKIPDPVDIWNRIELKERVVEENTQESKIDRMDEFMNESNQKQTECNEDHSETSTNENEGNISFLESNSEQEYDSLQLNNGKVIQNYFNDATALATGTNSFSKRPLQSDVEFSRKRVSIFELIN